MTTYLKASAAYKDVGLATKAVQHDQYQLVVMMLEGVLEALNRARGAMNEGDVVTKVQQITKAFRIIQEGLRTSLDLENGGELAANLAGLYDYCVMRLTQANASNDPSILEEVAGLIKPIAEAWKQMRQGPSHEPTGSRQLNESPTPPPVVSHDVPSTVRRLGQMYSQGTARPVAQV